MGVCLRSDSTHSLLGGVGCLDLTIDLSHTSSHVAHHRTLPTLYRDSYHFIGVFFCASGGYIIDVVCFIVLWGVLVMF